jgi:hypothetical protein
MLSNWNSFLNYIFKAIISMKEPLFHK